MHTNGRETKKDPTAGLDDGAAVAKLMAPFHQALIKEAFGDAADLGVVFDLENEFVQTVLKDLAKKVRGVADTTKQEVRDVIGRGTAQGLSVEAIAKELRELGDIRSKSRAIMISRTEAAMAHSLGSVAAYRASGVVTQTEWLLGPDPCEICQSLDGLKADLGEEFAPGVTGPPAHPNCTCALSPIVE